MAKMIADEFGKKIGGSKRDLWRARNLNLKDLDEMNSLEFEKYVKKENIWKKPDYEQLVKSGVPKELAYYQKKIRDSLPAKPFSNTEEDVRKYVHYISSFRDIVESMDEAGMQTFYKKEFRETFIDGVGYYRVIPKPEFNCLLTNKTLKAVQISMPYLKKEMKEKEFCMTDDEKILNKFSFYVYSKDSCTLAKDSIGRIELHYRDSGMVCYFHDYSNALSESYFKDGTWFVINEKSYFIAAAGFSCCKDAEDWVLSNFTIKPVTKWHKKPAKKKYCPPHLENIIQKGIYLHRGHVDASDYLNDFSFYGGEFGTWLSDCERQVCLDMGYTAFSDLAIALDIPFRDIAIGNRLSIAFGARGSGSAMAHFEPLLKVINLTKIKGAGSLAHEYGHAIDFIIGEQEGYRSLTASEGSVPEVVALMDVIYYREHTDNDTVMHTDFYINSVKMDKYYAKDSRGYWASKEEMFARAFACYVADKLKEKDIHDDYLCGHSDTCVGFGPNMEPIIAYPQKEEREVINHAFDELIAALKRKGYFSMHGSKIFYLCSDMSFTKKIEKGMEE